MSLSELRDQVHTVKSLAGTFGAPRLEAQTRELELACIEEDEKKVNELGVLLLTVYHETILLYKKHFADYMVELNKG